MAGILLSPGVRFVWNHQLYEIDKLLPNGYYQVLNQMTGAYESLSAIQITEELISGSLRFELRGKGAKEPGKAGISDEYRHQMLANLKREDIEIAEYRERVVKGVLSLSREQRTPANIQQLVERETRRYTEETGKVLKMPAIRTIQLWRHAYIRSGKDIRSLISYDCDKGGKGQGRYSPIIGELISTAIDTVYMTRERGSISKVHLETASLVRDENLKRDESEKLSCPSASSVRRAILRGDFRQQLERRIGVDATKRLLDCPQEGIRVTRTNERWEADATILNIIVIDPRDFLPIGRPDVVEMIDCYSKFPTGYYAAFEPVSAMSVLEAFRHAILPKTYVAQRYPMVKNTWDAMGLPEEVVFDRGLAFIAKDVELALKQIGVSIGFCHPRTPNEKPKIERFFRTYNSLVNCVPGTTFSNVFEKGDYDSKEHAVLTLDDFHKIFHIWLLDRYAQDFHGHLGGIPAKIWAEDAKRRPVVLPPNIDEFNVFLSCHEMRTIQRQGVEWQWLFYSNDQLTTLRARIMRELPKAQHEILMYYRPDDIGQIWVVDPFTGAPFKVPAVRQDYVRGKSLYKHKNIVRMVLAAKNEVDIVALGDAERELRKVVEEAWNNKGRGLRGRKQALRLKDRYEKSQDEIPPIQDNEPSEADSLLQDDPGGQWVTSGDSEMKNNEEKQASHDGWQVRTLNEKY